MIEVPPPQSFDGRTLRYGAMTCREYIWFRSKWTLVSCGFTFVIAIYQLTLRTAWGYGFAGFILLTVGVNLYLVFNWRHSWRYWNARLQSWLDRQLTGT